MKTQTPIFHSIRDPQPGHSPFLRTRTSCGRLLETVARLAVAGLLVIVLAGFGMTSLSAQTAGGGAPTVEFVPLRSILSGIHGFTRAGLEATGGDVLALLQQMIDDPAESIFFKRQAIKALALFPSEETFQFITARLDQAPGGLKRLYMNGLRAYGETRSSDVLAIVEQYLSDPSISMRYVALGLAAHVSDNPRLATVLQAGAAAEPDPRLRRAIQQRIPIR